MERVINIMYEGYERKKGIINKSLFLVKKKGFNDGFRHTISIGKPMTSTSNLVIMNPRKLFGNVALESDRHELVFISMP